MKNRNLDHKNDWKTPDSVFDFIFDRYGFYKENLFDPCPFMNDINNWDWLKDEWNKEKHIFINPPYELKLKEAFVKKWIEFAEKNPKRFVIMLLPVSTSTKLFHDYILPNKKEIHFLKWRVKFSWRNTKWEWVNNKCWMHDSMIVVF